MSLPLILFLVLFTIAIFAPLRWAIIAYLVLSTVDFYAGNSGIGVLNALKGLAYPVLLLWRLKRQAGHGKIVGASVAWILLVIYAAIAATWSAFPLSAVKLVAEMAGTFLICLAFLRAAKGGYLTPAILVPVTCGVLAIGTIRGIFMSSYGDEITRFSGFSSAQAYAAFLASLYAIALCSKAVKPVVRVVLCTILFAAILLDGSRIWTIGILTMTLTGLLISEARAWIKIYGIAALVLLSVALLAAEDQVMTVLMDSARTNRVAAALVATYQGNARGAGLGTYEFRRQLYDRAIGSIAKSSLAEMVFGHGTSNGRFLRGNLNQGIGDPNRSVHNEWLRIAYEWGLAGMALWLTFMGSIAMFAWQSVRRDRGGYARPLLAYIPALLGGLSTENLLAGAGHAENIGFLVLIALAAVAYRTGESGEPERQAVRWHENPASSQLLSASGR